MVNSENYKQHTTMNINHRPARNTDIPQIKKLIYATRLEFELAPDEVSADVELSDIEGHYQRGYFGVILDELKNVVGTFALKHESEDSCEIQKMYLTPGIRGKGLGKWMLNFLMEKAKTDGYNIIRLETANSLKTAQALYRKNGFREVEDDNISCGCDKRFIYVFAEEQTSTQQLVNSSTHQI